MISKMFNSSANVIAKENEISKRQKKLSYAVRVAIGHRSVEQFINECKMVDTTMIVDLLKCRLQELPPRQILRTIADKSEGRITYRHLYDICGYSEYDELEDRSWVSLQVKRGDIYYCDFGYNVDAEQGGIRPCVVIQNNLGNDKSSTIVVIPMTSKFKRVMPTHVKLTKADKMKDESLVLCEQIRCISKRRLFYNGYPWRVHHLSEEKIQEIQNALEIELGFDDVMFNEGKAFEMVKHIKALDYNIKVKRSNDLLDIFDEKLNEFINYCSKYKRNSDYILSEYERLHKQFA